MKSGKILFAALIFAIFATTFSHATLYSIDSGVSQTLLSYGSTPLTGYFNINSALPSDNYTTPYTISSATLTVNFSDNSDYLTYTGDVTYRTGLYEYRHFDLYTNPSEAVSVIFGSDFVPSVETPLIHTETVVQTIPHVRCTINGCYVDYTTYVVQQVDGHGGNLTITQNLNSTSLADLSQDGVTAFSIFPTQGDLYFNSAKLDLQIERNVASAPVPIPGAVWLLGSGLIGLIGIRRRFIKK